LTAATVLAKPLSCLATFFTGSLPAIFCTATPGVSFSLGFGAAAAAFAAL